MKRFCGILLSFVVLLACATRAGAQAVIDTSLNRVVPDTLPARTAPVLDEPAPDQQAYDSLKGVILPFQPNPKKSALYSAILPGSGQVYNRQYWKVPVIYAGMAVSFYFLIDNSNQYQRYRRAYIARINNPSVSDEFTVQLQGTSNAYALSRLKTLQDTYKQQLDLTYLLTGLGYTIQVLDALAFAHLKNFDISPEDFDAHEARHDAQRRAGHGSGDEFLSGNVIRFVSRNGLPGVKYSTRSNDGLALLSAALRCPLVRVDAPIRHL